LLIANYPFELTREPQALRAVLLASAQAHPIPVDGRTVPDFNDAIDDRTGAGAPNGDRARQIMDTHSVRHGTFLPTLPGQPGLGVVTFPTAGSERIRVVLTWEQCPDYLILSPDLFVDLDLIVRAPAGPPIGQTTAHTNISRRDNWEIVEFNSLRSGTVSVHVSAPVIKPCPSASDPRAVHFGLAWTSTPFVVNPRALTTTEKRQAANQLN
jgi:hypothetical protein